MSCAYYPAESMGESQEAGVWSQLGHRCQHSALSLASAAADDDTGSEGVRKR